MIYLFIEENAIKILSLNKTLLGQQETSFFAKRHETKLLENGKIINIDTLASAVKEAINLAQPSSINEKNVYLILPQQSFLFIRTTVPKDIAPSAINAFIKDKARSQLLINLEETINDSFIIDVDNQKIVSFYAMEISTLEGFRQALSLIDLKIVEVIPDTLAYFKLFEKTLRQEKKETIFYVFYDKMNLFGYLFDSWGLLDQKKWTASLTNNNIEEVLKNKINQLEEKNLKLNRIILSGSSSEKIRQDTFTKTVGVWTNPLKRIISNFYKDYLKLLIVENQQFSLLDFDICFGAFIFNQENKNFSLLKNIPKIKKPLKPLLSAYLFSKKELLIFVVSLAISFAFFIFISNLKLKPQLGLLSLPSPTPTPTIAPSATPTPSFKKEDLKIKVLNGSGVTGRAAEVKDILKNKGYQEILTGNADNFDYTQTVLQVKKSKSEAKAMIQADLKDYITSFKQTVLDEKEAADVVIIIGSDFK